MGLDLPHAAARYLMTVLLPNAPEGAAAIVGGALDALRPRRTVLGRLTDLVRSPDPQMATHSVPIAMLSPEALDAERLGEVPITGHRFVAQQEERYLLVDLVADGDAWRFAGLRRGAAVDAFLTALNVAETQAEGKFFTARLILIPAVQIDAVVLKDGARPIAAWLLEEAAARPIAVEDLVAVARRRDAAARRRPDEGATS